MTSTRPSDSICETRTRAASLILLLAILFLSALLAVQSAQAQTFTVLYSFQGQPDGGWPHGSLIGDAAGNLYGVTDGGGIYNNCINGFGCGTVYKWTKTGKMVILHSFSGLDGNFPSAGLVRDPAGNLYGTTILGGDLDLGTVFKLDRTGTETVLHSFTGGFTGEEQGQNPYTSLVLDAAGNVYGTTFNGGDLTCYGAGGLGCGVIFEVDTKGVFTVLHVFTGVPDDGSTPAGGVVLDSDANLYGTTQLGGAFNFGTVFKIDSSGTETILHNFKWPNGILPKTGLTVGAGSILYGTTYEGGDTACGQAYWDRGCGTVFKINVATGKLARYSFPGGASGAFPASDLVRDAAGNLYGTTDFGGDPVCNCGNVYKLDKNGVETVLHNFTQADLAGYPRALYVDDAGNVYGVASQGGLYNWGYLFEITP